MQKETLSGPAAPCMPNVNGINVVQVFRSWNDNPRNHEQNNNAPPQHILVSYDRKLVEIHLRTDLTDKQGCRFTVDADSSLGTVRYGYRMQHQQPGQVPSLTQLCILKFATMAYTTYGERHCFETFDFMITCPYMLEVYPTMDLQTIRGSLYGALSKERRLFGTSVNGKPGWHTYGSCSGVKYGTNEDNAIVVGTEDFTIEPLTHNMVEFTIYGLNGFLDYSGVEPNLVQRWCFCGCLIRLVTLRNWKKAWFQRMCDVWEQGVPPQCRCCHQPVDGFAGSLSKRLRISNQIMMTTALNYISDPDTLQQLDDDVQFEQYFQTWNPQMLTLADDDVLVGMCSGMNDDVVFKAEEDNFYPCNLPICVKCFTGGMANAIARSTYGAKDRLYRGNKPPLANPTFQTLGYARTVNVGTRTAMQRGRKTRKTTRVYYKLKEKNSFHYEPQGISHSESEDDGYDTDSWY